MNRRKLSVLAVSALLATQTMAQGVRPAIPRDEALEAKVEATLKKMTLDEKIGQMLTLSIDVLGTRTYENAKVDRTKLSNELKQYGVSDSRISEMMKLDEKHLLKELEPMGLEVYTPDTKIAWKLDEAKLDEAINKYKVGNFFNAPGQALSVDEWRKIVGKVQKKTMKQLGIPTLYALDNNHGASYQQGCILFPQPINVGASFNPSIAETMARVCAYETRAADVSQVYNPVLDLGRDPRWSRIWESFGEDAVVNARMAEAEIRGYQGPDPNHLGVWNVAPSVKHYLAYGAPWSGKDRTPAYLSPAMLREKYFAPFKAAVQAGALSIMPNSSSINGVPVHSSYKYLTQWLKKDLNWDGMIVTDWGDITNLYSREKVAKDKKEAIRMGINAGIDMSMDPYSTNFCTLLKELVEEGKVSMERIDDAVRRVLRLKYRLGLFDKPDTGGKGYEKYGSREFADEALRAAEETEVLLKNDGILPLNVKTSSAKPKKILVTGPNANQMRCLHGGWSYTWQGSNEEDLSAQYNTIYEAMCNKFGKENVMLEQGVTYNETGSWFDENEPQIGRAVSAAQQADIIVACVGENSYCETPGNLTDLTLSENQRNLVKALAKTGKPIILVLNEGRPRLITDIEPLCNAVVDILLPGNYGADALVNLLAGDANFSAKMPYTYPREINSLANYDYKVSEEVGTMEGMYNYDAKVSLLWPFGYGLSYTSYKYSNLRVDKTKFCANDQLIVSVDVTNSGARAGKEAVLLYSSDLVATSVPDNKRLRNFTKVQLQPGETKTITFKLPAKDLAFVDDDGKWRLEEGDFMLRVADLSQQVTCTATQVWDEPNI